MQQKRNALSVTLALALVFAIVPLAGAAAAPLAVDTQAPLVWGVIGAPNPALFGDTITVTATVDDSTMGLSNIQSAEFNVNGGAFSPLDATDGAFNSPTEAVEGHFTIKTLGDSTICVKGTDAAGNVSTEACADVRAESQIGFKGFFPPVKQESNVLKAGRTLPVKFGLEDAEGNPLNLITTFDGLYSYEVDCETGEGDPDTAVLEPGPGNAAVRSQGGMWLTLWKTDKSYADSCRMLYVLFYDGSASPATMFQFR